MNKNTGESTKNHENTGFVTGKNNQNKPKKFVKLG